MDIFSETSKTQDTSHLTQDSSRHQILLCTKHFSWLYLTCYYSGRNNKHNVFQTCTYTYIVCIILDKKSDTQSSFIKLTKALFMSMSNEILLEAPSASLERRRPTFHWSGDWEWYVGALIVATVLICCLKCCCSKQRTSGVIHERAPGKNILTF